MDRQEKKKNDGGSSENGSENGSNEDSENEEKVSEKKFSFCVFKSFIIGFYLAKTFFKQKIILGTFERFSTGTLLRGSNNVGEWVELRATKYVI